MSGSGSSPDESFSTLSAGCGPRETRDGNDDGENNENNNERLPPSASVARAGQDDSAGISSGGDEIPSSRRRNRDPDRRSLSSSSFFHTASSSYKSEFPPGSGTEEPSRRIYGELAVHSWGRGEDGQLGIGDTSDQDTPTYVDALRGVGVKEIACGSGHTVVLTGEGEVYTWCVFC